MTRKPSNAARVFLFALASLTFALSATYAVAQAYPSRPVRIIVPNPPGGSADVLSRLLSTRLSQALGQSVIIENRAGADGIIGSEVVANSPADGYTLLLASNSQYTINSVIYAKLPYDCWRRLNFDHLCRLNLDQGLLLV